MKSDQIREARNNVFRDNKLTTKYIMSKCMRCHEEYLFMTSSLGMYQSHEETKPLPVAGSDQNVELHEDYKDGNEKQKY